MGPSPARDRHAGRGRRCLVLGGGVAGLSSAFAHHEAGWETTLVETRRRLGGRAWSLSKDGIEFDNGPHVLLGCYERFRSLLRRLNTEDHFHHAKALELHWLREDGETLSLRCPVLPSPFHLLTGILRMRIPWKDRLALLAAGRRILGTLPDEGVNLDAWSAAEGIAPSVRRLLLAPLCRAVMNAEPAEAEARMFLETLGTAFRAGPAGGAMWIPRLPWSRILDPEPRSLPFTVRRGRGVGIEIRRPAPVLKLADGTLLEGHDRLVLALPPGEAARIAPSCPESALAGNLRPSPILTVYLPLPATLLPPERPILALDGGKAFHFLVRGPKSGRGGEGILFGALLAGAASAFDGLSRERILLEAWSELGRRFGTALPASPPEPAFVLRERRATFLPGPGHRRFRPPPGPTSIPGLWIAGDWTDTGLPATLEGAARSGFDPVQGPRLSPAGLSGR